MVIDGLAGGLHHKHIAAAHRLVDGDRRLAVSKALNLRLTQLCPHQLADLLGQRGIGISGKHLDILTVRNHCYRPLSVVSYVVALMMRSISVSAFPKPGLQLCQRISPIDRQPARHQLRHLHVVGHSLPPCLPQLMAGGRIGKPWSGLRRRKRGAAEHQHRTWRI